MTRLMLTCPYCGCEQPCNELVDDWSPVICWGCEEPYQYRINQDFETETKEK